MVAKQHNVDLAEFGIASFRIDFPAAIDRLCLKALVKPVDIACRESRQVPRNRVFVYFDPVKAGRVMVRHHPEDFEAVNTLVRECGNPFLTFESVASERA